MNNNIYQNQSVIGSLNNVIHNYLLQNLFTIELMEVSAINDNNTVELETIVYNVFTNGEKSETKNTLHNINVMMLKGGDISLSFQVAVGDIGLYLSFKKDFSNYLNNIDNTTLNKDIFKYTNGVFLPFALNNTLQDNIKIQKGEDIFINLSQETLTIKNKNSLIEVKDNNIAITGETVNITGNVVINGNLIGSGTLAMGGITASGSNISLGGDTPVARVGDSVANGVIVSGSSKVVAG